MFLPNGKDQNNTSSATKGDTFPSSYAGEGKKWGRPLAAPMNNE